LNLRAGPLPLRPDVLPLVLGVLTISSCETRVEADPESTDERGLGTGVATAKSRIWTGGLGIYHDCET
jgi:hypothetical protein